MKKFRFGYGILTVMILFAACTSTKQTVRSEQEETGIRIPPPPAEYTPDRYASHYYLQGIRAAAIHNDLENAFACFNTALEYDSLHAPSYYELSNLVLPTFPERALTFSHMANLLDSTNIWYKQQLGRLYIITEKYDSALTVYNDIVRLTPNNPENYRYLAALYDETRDPYTAITLLDSAEVRFGFIEELASYKRQLLIKAGLIDRAISETQSMTHNFPYEERNFILLGDLYARSGKDSLAIEAYDQALAIDPNSTEALFSLTEFYHNRNDATNFLATTKRLFESDAVPLDIKLTFFNEGIKNPQFYQQHYFAVNELIAGLAVKYAGNYEVTKLYAEHQINSGNLEGALETYKNTLTDTSSIELYNTIIDIESYFERSDSMVRYANLALERFPDNLDLQLLKGYRLYYLKEYDGAVNAMQEALKRTDNDSLKSVIYTNIGEFVHAKDTTRRDYHKYYRKALKFDPNNLFAIYSYANYLVDHGKNPELALKTVQEDSLKSMMYSTIGDIVHEKAPGTDYEKYYRKALEYDPDNIHALNNYSYYLSLEERELEKALEMIGRVMEIEPGNPTYIDTYGWILYKMGRYEEAKQAMRQAVTLDAGASKELLIHYGDVLYELKEYFMASVYWKKALEKGYDAEEVEARMKLIEGK